MADNLHDGIVADLEDDEQLRTATLTFTNNFDYDVTGYWTLSMGYWSGEWQEMIGKWVRAYRPVGDDWIEVFGSYLYDGDQNALTIPANSSVEIELVLEGVSAFGVEDFKVQFDVIRIADNLLQGMSGENIDQWKQPSDAVALRAGAVNLAIGPWQNQMPELFEDTLPMVVPCNKDYDLGYVDANQNPVSDGATSVSQLPTTLLADDDLVTLNLALPFNSDGKWKLTIPSGLRVWDAFTRERIVSDAWHTGTVSGLYVEGVSPSAAPVELLVTAQYTDGNGVSIGDPLTDSVLIEVVSVDLQIGELTEYQEGTIPACVAVNDDYDEGNVHPISGELVTDNNQLHGNNVVTSDDGTPAVILDPRILSTDDDLVSATLTIAGPTGQTGKYWIEVTGEPEYAQYIRLWLKNGTPVPTDAASALPITLNATAVDLLLEGLDDFYNSSNPIRLTAHFEPDGEYCFAEVQPDATNKAGAVVLKIDLDADSDNNGYINTSKNMARMKAEDDMEETMAKPITLFAASSPQPESARYEPLRLELSQLSGMTFSFEYTSGVKVYKIANGAEMPSGTKYASSEALSEYWVKAISASAASDSVMVKVWNGANEEVGRDTVKFAVQDNASHLTNWVIPNDWTIDGETIKTPMPAVGAIGPQKEWTGNVGDSSILYNKYNKGDAYTKDPVNGAFTLSFTVALDSRQVQPDTNANEQEDAKDKHKLSFVANSGVKIGALVTDPKVDTRYEIAILDVVKWVDMVGGIDGVLHTEDSWKLNSSF